MKDLAGVHSVFGWMDRFLIPPLTRLSEQRHLKAVRDGIVSTIPFIIVGSFFLIFAFPPFPALAALVKPHAEIILLPYRLTVGMMAVYATIGIGYHLARSYDLSGATGGLLAAAAFFLTISPGQTATYGWVLPLERLGGGGMFVGILTAILAVEVLRIAKSRRFVLRLPEGVPESVARSFEALLPGAVIIVAIWGIKVLGLDLHRAVASLLQPLVIAGNSLAGILVPIAMISLLWAAGIHGDSVVGTVARPVWLVLLDQNIAAAAAGQSVPNIAPEPFFQWFVWIGGSGASLGLVILMLFSRAEYLRSVAKAALIPGICNINEPVVFGVPLMLNPTLFIPFVVGPLLIGTITYLAMAFELVGRPFILVPWTLPAPLGAYLATGGDWRAVVLVGINIAVATLLYYPFFRAYEAKLLGRGEKAKEEAAEKYKS